MSNQTAPAKLNVLSLFAGIGGLELGLERAGCNVVGQVELDPFCRRVLAKHWPEVPRHDDVKTAADWWLSMERPTVDVICGGFPCQPFSKAGKQLGVADERWAWPWMADVVRRVRPRYVLVENVPALVRDSDAFGWMLGDLAEQGFDADWSLLTACAFGAPHARERLYLVAYANGDGLEGRTTPAAGGGGTEAVDPAGQGGLLGGRWDLPEPRPWGVAHGVPYRVDRTRAIGNAVVPAVSEHVGRLIVEHAQSVVPALGGVA